MKPRFAVVWFNPFFGQNKWKVQECTSMGEVWSFVDKIESMMKSCGYVLNFRLQNLRLKGDEEC